MASNSSLSPYFSFFPRAPPPAGRASRSRFMVVRVSHPLARCAAAITSLTVYHGPINKIFNFHHQPSIEAIEAIEVQGAHMVSSKVGNQWRQSLVECHVVVWNRAVP